uniref:Uncharacterized protein n=1 Tax=Acrobeloides nanus TaxID=290746 RepID=A0A914E411_9BILA
MMYTCRENCVVVDKDVTSEGVVSVFINKTTGIPNGPLPTASPFLPVAPPFLEPQPPETTTTSSEQPSVLRSELTPVWAVGIAIVIAIKTKNEDEKMRDHYDQDSDAACI